MVDFENRSGADVWVREHRKRRKPSFAGRPHLNITPVPSPPETAAAHDALTGPRRIAASANSSRMLTRWWSSSSSAASSRQRARKLHDLQRFLLALGLRPDVQREQLLGAAFRPGAPVVDAGPAEGDVGKWRRWPARDRRSAAADKGRQRGIGLPAPRTPPSAVQPPARSSPCLHGQPPRFRRQQRHALSRCALSRDGSRSSCILRQTMRLPGAAREPARRASIASCKLHEPVSLARQTR